MITLRHRFFWATLGGAALAGVLFLLVASILFTPRVARRLVEQQARLRLVRLLSAVPAGDAELKRAFPALARKPEWNDVRLVDPAVDSTVARGRALVVREAVPGSRYALELRPDVSFRAAMTELPPQPGRFSALVVGFLLFLYLLSWLLARYVTRPLRELEEAVTAFAEGGAKVTVVPPREQELAHLATAFNLMTRRLGDRERALAATSEQLEKALASKERIFANTSHELRTPLTVILGYAQLLQDGLKGALSLPQSEAVTVIENSAAALLAQVEDLLTLSRLQAGQLPLRWEDVDVRDLVEEVVSRLRPLLKEQPLGFECDARESYPARVDYGRGQQVLTNLLENARKYAPGTPIVVRLSQTSRLVEVEVRDLGPGIPAALEESLFLEFERGPDEAEGAGLGLALARALARQMGGDLTHQKCEPGASFLWSMPRGE